MYHIRWIWQFGRKGPCCLSTNWNGICAGVNPLQTTWIERGAVSSRVALLLRSTEAKPLFSDLSSDLCNSWFWGSVSYTCLQRPRVKWLVACMNGRLKCIAWLEWIWLNLREGLVEIENWIVEMLSSFVQVEGKLGGCLMGKDSFARFHLKGEFLPWKWLIFETRQGFISCQSALLSSTAIELVKHRVPSAPRS